MTNQRGDIAFLVLMGATGVDGRAVLLSQAEAITRTSNAPESEVRLAMAINRAVTENAAQAAPGEDLYDKVMRAVDQVIATIPAAEREAASQATRIMVKGRLAGCRTRGCATS